MIDDYLIYSNLPTIDLHGEDRISGVIRLEEFIKDNYKLHNRLLIVIHGKGKGILKQSIYSFLKRSSIVEEYKIHMYNDGATVILLKKKKGL